MNTRAWNSQSQFWKLFALSTLPIVAALATGFWLSHRIHEDQRTEVDKLRTEEVVAQDRLLVDALWSAIETVKTRALSLLSVREAQQLSGIPKALPDGMLLHWAEIEVRGGALHTVRQSARKTGWVPPAGSENFEAFYLKAAMQRLNLREIQENGVAVLRIQQDPHRSQEWLSLGFAGNSPASIVLALVDPIEVFPVFRRWTQRSEGGNLRGYLIGSDGYVLNHSQKAHISSDFSQTQAFQLGIREMLRGRQVSGAGVFKGVDQVPVTVAYARPGSLPIGAVVERVVPQADAKPIMASVFLALGALLTLCLGSAGVLRRLLPPVVAAIRVPEPQLNPASSTSPALMSDFLSIQEVWDDLPPPIAGMHAAAGATSRDMNAADAKQVEEQVVQELLSENAGETATLEARAEKILMAQFETESMRTQDPRLLAQKLADTAARVTESRALFFTYHSSLHAATLQAHSGFEPGYAPVGMSFALSSPMLSRIARYQKEGKVASISDDPALCLLLAKRLGTTQCEAWPMTDADGKVLGVLVVMLNARVNSTASLGSLEKVMKILGATHDA